MTINCSHVHTPPGRNRGQLRADLIAALGFADPQGAPPALTLAAMRTSMLYLLGYGAQINNPPPGIAATLTEYVNQAHRAACRRVEFDYTGPLPAPMVADGATTVVDGHAVQTLALAMYCAAKGKPEAKAYFEQFEAHLRDVAMRRPPGLVGTLDAFIRDAQVAVLRRVPSLRMKRWFAWACVPGARFYDLAANAEPAGVAIDPLAIESALIERGTVRTPLHRGLPGYSLARDVTGIPSHFDLGQCLEVWPAPDSTEARILIHARQAATPLTDDAHVPCVDHDAVYLLALAMAKAHFKRPDAADAMGMFEVQLQQLVAGTHGAARYITGRRTPAPYAAPLTTEPFPT